MKHRPSPAGPPPKAAAPASVETGGEVDDDPRKRIVARPDGFHWLAGDGRQEFGPFDTLEDALADMLAIGADIASTPGVTLHEVEGEIGVSDWIDPETGEPPEGQSPPHLPQE